MADYDAIVIGSGNNGLICALYLSQAGWRVLVLEQADDVGGAARTAEVTLPGFKHDLFATNLTLFTASPAYRDFKSELDTAGVRFLSSGYPYSSAYPDGKVARVYCDPQRTEAEMARLSPRDLTGWRHSAAFYSQMAPVFLPLHTMPLPSAAMIRQLGRVAMKGPSASLAMTRLAVGSVRRFVDCHFHSTEAKGLFSPWAFHLDFGPDIRGGAMFAYVSAMSAYTRGIMIAEGGAGKLSTAVRSLIEQRNGQIRTSTKVTAIDIRKGQAIGVKLEGGDTVTAERAVIANVAPKRLFGDLVPSEHVPSRFFRRIGRFRHAVGTFVVHLALSGRLQWKAAADLSEFGYVHLNGTPEDIEQTYTQALQGLLPARPMLIVSQTSQVDPSRAPAGNHVARVHARAFPTQISGDAAGAIQGRDWDEIKEAVADRILAGLAEHAPNLNSILLAVTSYRHLI